MENEKSDFRREKEKESWCNVCLGEFLKARFNYEIFLRCNTVVGFKRWKLIFSSEDFFLGTKWNMVKFVVLHLLIELYMKLY